jgi:hypothetical protein
MVEDNKKKPVIFPLSKEDEKFLTKARHLGERICDYYTHFKPKDIGPTELDQVYDLWIGDQES